MIDAILKRRSIRKYTGAPIDPGTITKILEAAMAAPSGHNSRPWHFVVVTERETLNALAAMGRYWGMLADAPLAIVVCSDPGISESYWDQDAVAATENALLAASMLGLGAVWLGCHPDSERMGPVRERLGIPADIVPVSVISVGHPAEDREPRTQYDETRVHRERW